MTSVDLLALARELSGDDSGGELRLRKGTVTTGGASTVTVRVGGSTTDLAGVRTLWPLSTNDVCWLLQQGPLLLAVGKLGGAKAPDADLLDGLDSAAFARVTDSTERGGIYRNTSFTITTTEQLIPFPQGAGYQDSVPSTWATATNTQLTVPATARAGLYQVTGEWPVSAAANETLTFTLRKGTTITGDIRCVQRRRMTAASSTELFSLSGRPVYMAPGDTFVATCQSDGANSAINGGFYVNPYIEAYRIGPN